MKRRTLLATAATLPAAAKSQSSRLPIVFWHAMTAANAAEIDRLAREFNESQPDIEVQPVYKGGYGDVMTAAIAAWRADQAPHIVQIFEVGTGSMLAAGPATIQAWKLAEQTGIDLDPNVYIPGVRGYYSLTDGKLASVPFNSSTAVMWYNKDALKAAGFLPTKPPLTWGGVLVAARGIKAKIGTPEMGGVKYPMTSSWLIWTQLEQYSAIHDLPFATRENGFEGLDAELRFNGPGQVRHWNRLIDMAKEGLYEYGGRDTVPDALFHSGQAAIAFGSSAARGQIAASAKFDWGESPLPFELEAEKKPINSIIGGASLWTMTAKHRTPAEYKAVALFLKFLSQPEQDAHFHQTTGYVPVTLGGFEKSRADGYYEKQPGADIPILQLKRGTVTGNSRGLRLGRLSEIRNILYEETEKALQGQQSGQEALDNGVRRGNRVLRDFQKSVGG